MCVCVSKPNDHSTMLKHIQHLVRDGNDNDDMGVVVLALALTLAAVAVAIEQRRHYVYIQAIQPTSMIQSGIMVGQATL